MCNNSFFDSVSQSLKVIMESKQLRDIILRDDFAEFTQEQLEKMATLDLYDYHDTN